MQLPLLLRRRAALSIRLALLLQSLVGRTSLTGRHHLLTGRRCLLPRISHLLHVLPATLSRRGHSLVYRLLEVLANYPVTRLVTVLPAA